MTYTPINWQTGDTITAEKMNKMDNGWDISDEQLFSETVTTESSGQDYSGQLTYSGTIDYSTLIVTFNGIEYTCPRIDVFGSYFYGGFTEQGPDFTDYPFAIQSSEGWPNTIYTENAGTYAIAANAPSVNVSQDFNSAVHACIGNAVAPMLCVVGETTYDQMTEAWENRQMMYFVDGYYYFITEVWSDGSSQGASFIPENEQLTATFEDGIFTLQYS